MSLGGNLFAETIRAEAILAVISKMEMIVSAVILTFFSKQECE